VSEKARNAKLKQAERPLVRRPVKRSGLRRWQPPKPMLSARQGEEAAEAAALAAADAGEGRCEEVKCESGQGLPSRARSKRVELEALAAVRSDRQCHQKIDTQQKVYHPTRTALCRSDWTSTHILHLQTS
jgi:hypothetical protein